MSTVNCQLIVKIRNLSIFFFFFLFTYSCEPAKKSRLLAYSGAPGKIVTVLTQEHWNGEIGELIRTTLGKPQYGLPQSEPTFDLLSKTPKTFQKYFKTQRNIFIVNISDTVKKSSVEIKTNPWASRQIAITLHAADNRAFIEMLKKHHEGIMQYYQRGDIEKLISRNKTKGEKLLNGQILENHGISIALQKDCEIVVDSSNFVWIRLERERQLGGYYHQISQGLLLFYEPYNDTSQLTVNYIHAWRDSVLQERIPGPKTGSYMATDYQHIPPKSWEINLTGNYAIEIRGLWRMKNVFMGGPFICLTAVDEKYQRVVTAYGYVFAPEFDKLDYLREVEAMLKSVEFSKEETN